MDRMLLLLEPSAAQKQALDQELVDQQSVKSPQYHHWLTPAEFAEKYANSAADVTAVVAWLQSEGFTVAPLPAGRGWIEFSGSAGQVEQAFQTRVNSVATESGARFTLADSTSVPAALRPLIHGLVSLDGVVAAPAITTPQVLAGSVKELANASSLTDAEAMTPKLTAQLLHLDILHTSGATGTGETIAIAARSNMDTQDVAAFRGVFGLPAGDLQVAPNGSDPGRTSDEAEAVLSASWAGAAAPGAQIVLVPAGSTAATDGLDLSLAAIVDGSIAKTVAVGFSACEGALSEAHQAFYAALYRQAAAEGISILAASGDSGASACQSGGTDSVIATGYAVNAIASTPWNTAVGAVAMADAATADAAGAGAASTSGTNVLAGWSPRNPADPEYAGGGGNSTVYAMPAWQPLPVHSTATTSARMVPDIALPTAIDSGASRGVVFCLSGEAASVSCHAVRSGGSAAAAAIFAGIAAVINERNGVQGNLAPHLYALTGQSGIFEDVQQGSARLWCAAGSPNCDASGQIGFGAAAGYDLATGLGSVDAEKLVNEWPKAQATGTGAASVSIAVTPTVANTTYNPTAQITLTANVVSGTGGATPTGTVSFVDATTGTTLNSSGATLDASGVATYTSTTGLATGGNNITAVYSGDATYASVSSQPLVVTIEPSTTTPTTVPATTKPTAGLSFAVTVTIAVGSPPAGTVAPTGTVTLNVDGLPSYTASLSTSGGTTTAIFSAVTINAAGDHPLQAVYAGDANYDASTASAVTVSIAKGATVTALTATPTTLTSGVVETFTATIAPSNAEVGTTYSLTGTVSFYDGTILLGTSVISANSASLANITLAAGTLHTITAVYSGDTNWATSTSNAITLQSALLPVSVSLAVSINTVAPGQVVTISATVTPVSAPASNIEQNPTGNVIFYNGTTVIGSVALTSSLNYSSTASITTATLQPGQDVLTAYYVGDLYFAPGTSNAVTIDVEDFSIEPSAGNPPTNLNIIKGSAGTASFVVKGLGGFSSQIQVVCAVPSQDDMTCQASPQRVTPQATVTFTVQTFAAGGTTAGNNRGPMWPRGVGGTALAALLFLLPFGRRARMFSDRVRRFLVVVLLLAALGGAGIGCSNSTTTPQTGGTPLGVATLTITATTYVDNTVVSHNVFLTVNVLPPGSTTNASQVIAHR